MSQKVLIVDDSKELLDDLHKITSSILKNWQFHCHSNLFDAIRLASTQVFNLLITDLRLDINESNFSGLQLINAVQKFSPKTHIIVVSSYLGNFLEMSNHLESLDYISTNIIYLDRNQSDYSRFVNLLKFHLRSINISENKSKNFDIDGIWNTKREINIFSYWILILMNIEEQLDKKLATELLLWENLYTNNQSKVLIIQPSNVEFDFIYNYFSVKDFPCLIFSRSSNFSNFELISPKTLNYISKTTNGIKKLLINLHAKSKLGSELNLSSNLINELHIKNSINDFINDRKINSLISLKSELKELIKNPSIEPLIERLFEIIKDDSKLFHEVLMNSGRLRRINFKIQHGLVNEGEAGVELNKISNSTIKIIDSIDSGDLSEKFLLGLDDF